MTLPADLVERLRERTSRVKYEGSLGYYSPADAALDTEAATLITTLSEELEAVKEALKPFAEAVLLSQSTLIVASDGTPVPAGVETNRKHVTLVMYCDAAEAFNRARSKLGEK